MRISPIFLIAIVALTGGPSLAQEPGKTIDPQVQALVNKYCLKCHGEKLAEKDLRLDQLDFGFDQPQTFDRWQLVAKRLHAGDMPPEEDKQPDKTEVKTVLLKLSDALNGAAAQRRKAGRTVLRRLNRVEYENTVRDLFAVDVNVRKMLPEDTSALGFDNVGTALQMSPSLVEQYLEAADVAISEAILPIPKAENKTLRLGLAESIPVWAKPGVFVRDETVILFNSERSATSLDKFRAPVAGTYRFTISTSAYQSVDPQIVAVTAGNFVSVEKSNVRLLGYFDALPGEPQQIVIEAHLGARDTIKIMPTALPRVYLKQDNIQQYPGSGLAIHGIEIEGPLPQEWPTQSYRRVFGDVDPKQGTVEDAEKLLREFLPRAYRGKITDVDIKPFVNLVAVSMKAGQTFDLAYRGALKAVLCSPRFLYFKESPGELDDYALATRLSYFLWSTTPDDTLLELADSGKLHKPDVLHAEVERMLSSDKAHEFTRNFLGQWLGLRQIEANAPDHQLYPEFDELLKWSMVRESEEFFEELLKHDQSLLNFVDSDFSMLNQRMARHYGIAGVQGVAFRKVPLPADSHRGGVMTQAAVLKITANGTSTSPVVRGVWIVDHMLGKHPPPPPANVPAIEPDIRGATTIREQLAKHRDIAACASCHAKFDYAGFALENFDVIGGWRDRYRIVGTKDRVKLPDSPIAKYAAKPEYGLGSKVDAGDVLPDGRKFETIEQFKKLLLADPDGLADNLTEKLLVYATGQGIEFTDHAHVEKIVAEAKQKDYGLRTLIHAIVADELFRTK